MKNSINSIGTTEGYVVETGNVPDRERKEQRLDVRAGLVAHASLLVLVQVTWASSPLFGYSLRYL